MSNQDLYTLLPNGTYRRNQDGACIPNDPANVDCAIAQAWIKANKKTELLPSLEEVKAEKIASVYAIAAGLLTQLVANRSAAETLMWTPKAQESEQFLELIAQPEYDTKKLPERFPLLFAEAKTAIAVESLAKEVLEKQLALKTASGKIIGTRTRKKSEIESIQKVEDAIAYDPNLGWD